MENYDFADFDWGPFDGWFDAMGDMHFDLEMEMDMDWEGDADFDGDGEGRGRGWGDNRYYGYQHFRNEPRRYWGPIPPVAPPHGYVQPQLAPPPAPAPPPVTGSGLRK